MFQVVPCRASFLMKLGPDTVFRMVTNLLLVLLENLILAQTFQFLRTVTKTGSGPSCFLIRRQGLFNIGNVLTFSDSVFFVGVVSSLGRKGRRGLDRGFTDKCAIVRGRIRTGLFVIYDSWYPRIP